MKMRYLNTLFLIPVIAFAYIGCSKSSSSQPGNPGPSVSALHPSHGPDSTKITISGTGFGNTLANDAVSFNGKQATVLGLTDTTITAMVPTLAGTGNVTISVNGQTINGGVFTYDTTWRLSVIADNLQIPYYLAVDGSGNLFAPTYNDGVINKISPQGTITPFANLYCWGTALDPAGNLYVVSNSGYSGNDSGYIYKYSPSGVRTLIAADSGTIFSIALDKSNNVYASNTGRNTIDKITPSGVVSTVASNLYAVTGLGVTSDGTIYAANFSVPVGTSYNEKNGVVTKITPSGTVSTVTSFLYDGQNGIAVDANDNVYVTVFDQGNVLGSVMRITPAGTATSLTSANIQSPCGIAVDHSGNLYVVQQEDHPFATVGSIVKMTMH
jgi:sugar lactone lactonase YvrE